MKRRPTIIDVASKAGVSKSTVSLVLQNSPSVKEETRKQVRAAMAEIGYVYNRSAANMRKSNAGLVGLVINDLRNPFFTEFATSLQMALAASGYSTVVANTDENPDLQLQVVSSMIEHGVSALIVCSAYDDNGRSFDAIARAGIPALQMLRCVDDRVDQFPFAAPEYQEGSRLATQHLVDMGAKNIAFVGGIEGRAVAEERKQGYYDVLKENGMTPIVLPGRAFRDFGRAAAGTLLRDHPDVDAAICFNDLVALGLLHGCYENGRAVGEAFRIVGFDDIEEVAQSFPAITSVRCDIGAIGQATARTVIDWLEEGKIPPAQSRSPVSLSIRASSTGREGRA